MLHRYLRIVEGWWNPGISPRNLRACQKKKQITVFKKQHIFLFRLFSRWNYTGRAEPVSLWMLYGEGPTPTLFRAASDRFFTVHQLSELTWQKISNFFFFFLPGWRTFKRLCICMSIGIGTKHRVACPRRREQSCLFQWQLAVRLAQLCHTTAL